MLNDPDNYIIRGTYVIVAKYFSQYTWPWTRFLLKRTAQYSGGDPMQIGTAL